MQPNQLEQLLKFLSDTLQQGKDFSVEQAPLFVKELLAWRVAEDTFWCAFGLFLIFLSIILGILAGRSFPKGTQDRRSWHIVPPFGALVIATIIWSFNIYDIVKVKVAPRVVIVEMVRNLIAGPGR